MSADISCSRERVGLATRQLATLVEAGVPIFRGLSVMANHQEDSGLRAALEHILTQVERGQRLSKAMSDLPYVFPRSYVAMVAAAETTGRFAALLGRLADWLEEDAKTVRRVRKAMIYPVFVLLLTGGLVTLMFLTVIPGLLETVEALGAPLPWPTLVVRQLSHCFSQPIFWVMGPLSLWPLVRYLRTPLGQAELFTRIRTLPGIGPVLIYSCAARYASTLALLLETGNEMLTSVRLAAAASGSPLLRDDSERIVSFLRDGVPLVAIWDNQPLDYPSSMRHLVGLGEEAGHLSVALRRAADGLAQVAAERIETMTAMLEPLLLAGVAVTVGFVVVALLLPLSSVLATL
ncbi:MAG: type II secretion system F family protein [Candidatus Eremiobacteraeota bacterium]|nr:type II secretion system F family protein [Candidatus Eremiobacteraeota bacterium]